MKNFSAILLAISLAASSSTFAVDCNRPPSGSGGNWARAYASWCQQCGGTYNPSNQSCNPGPNWGGGRPSGRESFYDQEAERQRQEAEYQRQQEAELQRQRDIEEQKRREEEAARKRREDFERSKQNALKSMKGIAEGELGLKGGEAGENKIQAPLSLRPEAGHSGCAPQSALLSCPAPGFRQPPEKVASGR